MFMCKFFNIILLYIMENLKWTNGTVMEKSMRSKSIDTRTYTGSSNRTDKFNDLINLRETLPTSTINPFMISNNYLADLETHAKFLIPQNSQY